MGNPLEDLTGRGVSIWLDDLSRELLDSGELARLVKEKHVTGVTSNPTIFASALAKGDRYEDQITALAAEGADVDKVVFTVTTDDVRSAADVLRPVYDATDRVDGRVSIEVDPRLALDTEGSIESAKTLWTTVDRPNAMIKIPATPAGLPAISAVLAQGISVNVTLIFSLERYRAVLNAFLVGLERAKEAGHDLAGISSVASFFVSRVDTEIDKRLEAIGTEEALALRGQAAVANARLAYEIFEEVTETSRWQLLAAAGARPQRPLWASTGVKNPAYPDTLYVTELVAPHTVNTMPGSTLSAFADHGVVTGDTARSGYDEARALLDRLEGLGVSYREVVETLETEGVDKFEKSWAELASTVSDELARLSVADSAEEASQ
jgi:transaldolase